MRLRIKAPFGAFRYMTAGSFRPTAPFMTPAAAYGLLLNLAGVDSRRDDGKTIMTLMRDDLPSFDLAIGINTPFLPEEQTLFQQLHNYPVGGNDKIDDPENPGTKTTKKKEGLHRCRAGKYNIQPIRRGFLTGLDAIIAVRGNEEMMASVRQGLADGAAGILNDGRPRYGIPFLGDNNFMIDILREESSKQPIRWFYKVKLREMEAYDLPPQLSRMPIWIDRAEMSHTVTGLFAVSEQAAVEPPEEAWTNVGPPSSVMTAV